MRELLKIALLGAAGWWAWSEFVGPNLGGSAPAGGGAGGADGGAAGNGAGAGAGAGSNGSGSGAGSGAGSGSGGGGASVPPPPVWFVGPPTGGIPAPSPRSADSDLATRILARAGTAKRNFYHWNWFYEQETGHVGPDPIVLFQSADDAAAVEQVELTFEEWWAYMNAALTGGALGRLV